LESPPEFLFFFCFFIASLEAAAHPAAFFFWLAANVAKLPESIAR
jgi:hypothetical protein